VLTKAELAQYDGRNGHAAYIAFRGVVYDVSKSWHWRGGKHQVVHLAGTDLTGEIAQAPHGAEMLDKCPVVDKLD
jgi:predicted heme/steroid binding protein